MSTFWLVPVQRETEMIIYADTAAEAEEIAESNASEELANVETEIIPASELRTIPPECLGVIPWGEAADDRTIAQILRDQQEADNAEPVIDHPDQGSLFPEATP